MTTPNWHEFFLGMCIFVAQKSKDPSTKTGCVIVDGSWRVRAIGFNGFPQGVTDVPSRYENRPLKYKLIAHCDSNAIFSAARIGIPLDGCTMYLTVPPCAECTKGIIQAGIRRVIWPADNPFENDEERRARWSESLDLGAVMASEAGVDFVRYDEVTETLAAVKVNWDVLKAIGVGEVFIAMDPADSKRIVEGD